MTSCENCCEETRSPCTLSVHAEGKRSIVPFNQHNLWSASISICFIQMHCGSFQSGLLDHTKTIAYAAHKKFSCWAKKKKRNLHSIHSGQRDRGAQWCALVDDVIKAGVLPRQKLRSTFLVAQDQRRRPRQ